MGKPAARLGDHHVCPMVTGVVPHIGGPIAPACQPNVLIGNQPAARVGDNLVCVGPPDTIVQGEPTVHIGGKPAARLGDSTIHGGKIVGGEFTVLVGGNNTVTLGQASVTIMTTTKDGKKGTITLKENDRIAGRPINNIKPGTSDKAVIIGRKMDGHVKAVAAELEAMGVNVEIFDGSCQTGTFKIDDKTYTWDDLSYDFSNPVINASTGYRRYTPDPEAPKYIAEKDIPDTLVYKANKQWIERVNADECTVINMGYPPPPTPPPSPFYNMELGAIDF